MTIILVILIIALALLIAAECWIAYWLHKKIGIFKDKQRKLYKPDFSGLEAALFTIRSFSRIYYPEGHPRLDLAAHELSVYCKHMRWQAKQEILKQQNKE